jgi:hypothetical protein
VSLREAAWEGERPWERDEDRRDAVSCADRSEKVDVTDYGRKSACLRLLHDTELCASRRTADERQTVNSTGDDNLPADGIGLGERRFEGVETLCNGIIGVADLDMFSSRNATWKRPMRRGTESVQGDFIWAAAEAETKESYNAAKGLFDPSRCLLCKTSGGSAAVAGATISGRSKSNTIRLDFQISPCLALAPGRYQAAKCCIWGTSTARHTATAYEVPLRTTCAWRYSGFRTSYFAHCIPSALFQRDQMYRI